MDPRIEAALDEWRFRSCDPGFAGLHTLADAGFTGAVTTGETVGFVVNGRLVGLTGGTTETFWGSEFTALEAESPALPLLGAMLSTTATEEGEYYTGESPLAEVDETLSDGGFTGYLELSENVFSGDYFIAYYGGRSFPVAFLGSEERIVTGEEARERATDEVGIYTVNSVEIDVVEIPDPDVDDSAGAATTAEEPSQGPEPEESARAEPEEVDEPSESRTQGGAAATQQASHREERSELAELAESALGTDAAAIDGPTGEEPVSADEWLAIPALDPDRTGALEPPNEPEPPEPEPEDPVPEDHGSTSEAQEPRSELEEALEEAKQENERLRERIAELEDQVAEYEAEVAAQESSMDPGVALDGTNLFVRYDTQSNFTLEHALEGDAEREEVIDNLRLEWHTAFDATDVTVDGQPFESFLYETSTYQFSQWLLGELLFELVDRGEAPGFGDLLEVLPEIDRIEFRGDIPVHRRDGGERESETYTYDVVLRNSMGDPVMLAEVHEGRDPVRGEALDTLLAETKEVAKERQTVAGAFYVSRSYFEPAALETVADATGGGFLRGGSRTSYVSVSRKRGFHLCLVEARDDSFHLNIPGD